MGLSPEPCCVDNHSISRRYQPRIATVIHITVCDLTNCARSEPFVASLCGGLWSAFTPHLRQGPSSRYCPEIATAPAGSSRRASHGTSQGPPTPEVPGGYELTGPRGARRPPARTQPLRAPAREPPPHRVHPSSVRGPLSRPRLKIATAPAGSTRPGAQPLARRPPAAVGHHRGPLRRQSPTSAHARCRAGNGEERGRTLCARNPATLPLKSSHQPHGVCPASVRGPWSAVAVARCLLIGGRGVPCRAIRADPEPPHIVCPGTTPACGNEGPPPLPVSPPPLPFGRGGGL